eukprot:CAMPEP_0119283154 /NCGR_PEP_ID=MMETSP1329-20130426/28008_1 /TAXON_ID=114041 /ORGANISM="Genus nov. species nov., Strain RCC1024" /LENGTH=365 /DNA_ID=CAMNT_0007283819 /DNA_START=92 /DNA_END=1185 /DNA_ORIENTATION=-
MADAPPDPPAAKRPRTESTEGDAGSAPTTESAPPPAAPPPLAPAKMDIACVVSSSIGKRQAMEDAHVVADAAAMARLLTNAPPNARVAVYAVLDGHNGRRVADLCGELLPKAVARELNRLVAPAGAAKHPWSRPKKVEAALKRACAALEAAAAKSGFDKEGCCCVAAVVVQDEAYIVNLGDSRAVLVRRGAGQNEVGSDDTGGPPGVGAGHRHRFPWDLGQGSPPEAARALTLTADHRCSAPAERARIVAAGGSVDPSGRAAGMMEVARSFGDADVKKLCRGVVAEPDLRVRVSLTGRDEFLLLACDGLFARVSPLKAATFVRARLAAGHSFLNGNRHEWDFPKTVRALVDDAVHCKTCTDNVSV